MRLFYFIEKHNTVGLAADFFRELTRIVISDISGRRAHKTRNGMLLHKFRHIHAYETVGRIEEVGGKHLYKLCLADARRSRKDERNGFALVGNAGAVALYRAYHGVHSRVLPLYAGFESRRETVQALIFVCRY